MEMNIHSILPEEIAAMGGHSNRVLNEKNRLHRLSDSQPQCQRPGV